MGFMTLPPPATNKRVTMNAVLTGFKGIRQDGFTDQDRTAYIFCLPNNCSILVSVQLQVPK